MLLIIFLVLIAKLPLVSGNCDFGTPKLDNFDWTKVGFSVYTRFQQQATIITAVCFSILFVVPLKTVSNAYQVVSSND